MKKFLSLILVLLMAFSIVACDKSGGSSEEDDPLTMSEILENLDEAGVSYNSVDDEEMIAMLEANFKSEYDAEVAIKSVAINTSGLTIVEFATTSNAKTIYEATKADPDSEDVFVHREGKVVIVSATEEFLDAALGKGGSVDDQTSGKDETSTEIIEIPSNKFDIEAALEDVKNAGFEMSTDPEESKKEMSEMLNLMLEELKTLVKDSTDEEIEEALGVDASTVKEVANGISKIEVVSAYEYEGILSESNVVIIELDNEDQAEGAKKLFAVMLAGDGNSIKAEKNVVVVSDAEELADLVINGPEEVEDLNGKDAEQIYGDAYDYLANITNGTITTEQDIHMDMTAPSQGVQQSVDVIQTVVNQMDNDNFYNKITSSVNGEVEAWYINGMYYQNNQGTKQKGELDIDKYYTSLGLDPDQKFLAGVDASMLKDAKFEKLGETYYLAFTIDGESYTETMGNAIADMYAQYDVKVKISDVAYRVYFDADGNIENMIADYTMDMNMTISGIDMNIYAEVSQVSTFEKLGSTEVNAPSGTFQSVVWQY
ncbi:MAG: hypothetical protein IJZ93_00095 [Clostridia bacterium]|nr:hypothetical protein [Clostridia bacterium]